MTLNEFGIFFRRMTAGALVPLAAASAYLLREVMLMCEIPSYSLDTYAAVPDIIGVILGGVVLYLAVSLVLLYSVSVRMNRGNNNRRK